jgi:hypothetical protein
MLACQHVEATAEKEENNEVYSSIKVKSRYVEGG